MRYVSDWLIEDIITQLLIDNTELSSNKLRLAIKENVSYYAERKRKNRREKDRNVGYVPSPAKISATIKQLLEWQWLQRREEQVGGLKKVFYSLSEYAKFGFSIAMNPKDSYKLRVAYQMILRSTASSIFEWVWDTAFKKDGVSETMEESMPVIYLMKERRILDKFKPRKFLLSEIERAFTEAFKDGVIEKKPVNNEIKCVINNRLKRFINDCWEMLYFKTEDIVKNVIIWKKIPKNNSAYEKIHGWLVDLHGDEYASNFFRNCQIERKNYTKKADKKKLEEIIKEQLDNHSKLKERIIARYEKDIDNEATAKFKDIKESVLHYTSPSYVIEAVDSIRAETTTKSKNIKKSKLHNPQFESVADIIEMEQAYKREDIEKQRFVESVSDIISPQK
jgi:hypothetical protein